jgi:hypothetical protein
MLEVIFLFLFFQRILSLKLHLLGEKTIPKIAD